MSLTIVAHVFAKPDQIGFVKSQLESLITPTKEEEGCHQYDLHQDHENPAHFMFYENWSSADAWQAHMASPHLKRGLEAMEPALQDVKIYQMARVEP